MAQSLLTAFWIVLPSVQGPLGLGVTGWSLEEYLTMNPQEITKLLTAKPFQPFRLHLTDGRTFDVHHPDFVLVGARTAHVYEVLDHTNRTFSDYAIVSLLHITRIEFLSLSENAVA